MNKYVQHLYVVPEDDANRQLADGFVLHFSVDDNRVRVTRPIGGWLHVRDKFETEYIPYLRKYPQGHVILLVDFDAQIEQRQKAFDEVIPEDLKPRVFVIGARKEPEQLKAILKKGFEAIGQSLADDCNSGTTYLWNHSEFQHNDTELQRLVQTVKPFLFISISAC